MTLRTFSILIALSTAANAGLDSTYVNQHYTLNALTGDFSVPVDIDGNDISDFDLNFIYIPFEEGASALVEIDSSKNDFPFNLIAVGGGRPSFAEPGETWTDVLGPISVDTTSLITTEANTGTSFTEDFFWDPDFQLSTDDNFIMVTFQREGNTHYGYIEVFVDNLISELQGRIEFTLLGYAWETTPDTEVAAFSIVPEPAHYAKILLCGCLGYAVYRRRR